MRTAINVAAIIRAGVSQPAQTFADITNGNYIPSNTGKTFLELANVSNAGSVNVTFDIPYLFDTDLSITDIIVALAPGGIKYVGPFKSGVFNQGSENTQVFFNVGSTGVGIRGFSLIPT